MAPGGGAATSEAQIGPVGWNVTSARWTQLETGGGIKARVNFCAFIVRDRQTLNRESQELFTTLSFARSDPEGPRSLIVCTDIPQLVQLNSINSTQSTLDGAGKSKTISVAEGNVVCSVSS